MRDFNVKKIDVLQVTLSKEKVVYGVSSLKKSTGALINHSRSCRGHDYNGSQRVLSLKDGNINYDASPKPQQALIIIELITVNGMPFNST